MSWKNLVSAGLLCVLASPVFAVPTISVTPSATVNANNDRVWTVTVTPGVNPTALAVELPFTHQQGSSALPVQIIGTSNTNNVGASNANTTSFYYKTNTGSYTGSNGVWVAIDTDNPGTPLIDETNEQNTGTNPFTTPANQITTGLWINGANLFASLGSVNFPSAGAQNTVQIVTKGGGGILHLGSAIIATEGGPNGSQNWPIAAKDYYVPGDFDGQGIVGTPDLDLVLFNYGAAAPGAWDGHPPVNPAVVGTADLDKVLFNYGAGQSFGSGSGLGDFAVPEPTSMLLLLVGGAMGFLGSVRRRK